MNDLKLKPKLLLTVPIIDDNFNEWTFIVNKPKEKNKKMIITKILKKKQYGTRGQNSRNRLF